METPFFISYFSKKIGKPVSAFTKADWQLAAMTAAEFLDNALPPPKKRGAPKKQRNRLYELLCPEPKNPVGRPRQMYGREKALPIEDITEILDGLMAHTPRSQIETMRTVLRALGGHASEASAVLRSVHSYRKQLGN